MSASALKSRARSPRLALFVSLFIFILMFWAGVRLSDLKPLWNDEIYTQVHSIEALKVTDIILGKIPEGNAAPLFYLVQKGILNIFSYHSPSAWDGEYAIRDYTSQLLLRLSPNFFMSLAVALTVYFFMTEFSFLSALLTLFLFCSSFMAIRYWLEARPYAQWYFLTTLQILVLLRLIKYPERPHSIKILSLTHLAMALTTAFAVVQIWIASAVLFLISRQGKKSKYIFLTLIPSLPGLYYYLQAPKYHFFLETPLVDLILRSFPLEWIAMVVLALIFLAGKAVYEKKYDALGENSFFLAFYGLTLLSAAGLGGMFTLDNMRTAPGFAVSDRYFFYLVPLNIIGITLFIDRFLGGFKDKKWMYYNFIIIMGCLIVMSMAKTINHIIDIQLF